MGFSGVCCGWLCLNQSLYIWHRHLGYFGVILFLHGEVQRVPNLGYVSDATRWEMLLWDASYRESREFGVRRAQVLVQTARIHGEDRHAETIRVQTAHATSFGRFRASVACDRFGDRAAADESALDQ
jgi:hypothetical protein